LIDNHEYLKPPSTPAPPYDPKKRDIHPQNFEEHFEKGFDRGYEEGAELGANWVGEEYGGPIVFRPFEEEEEEEEQRHHPLNRTTPHVNGNPAYVKGFKAAYQYGIDQGLKAPIPM